MSKAKAVKFNKLAILKSEKYGAHRDLLQALLAEGESYTLEEVDKKVREFLEKEVD